MYSQRLELVVLEAQLAEARQLAAQAHNDHWRQHHERTVAWLRGAVAEARSRVRRRSR
jgi:hypothetical protein